MTTIGITQSRRYAADQPVRRSAVLQMLLSCGILASVLYISTDILGGLRYSGYSFTSQAISELGAIGAPSRSFVAPLFLAYDVLALAFAIGIVLEAAPGQRSLQITGIALLTYGAVGVASSLVGPFFSMQQRGVGNLSTDAPHIILTGVLVLLLLIAIGCGAFALGPRFKWYSLATLATMIVFGLATIPFATRLSAGQSTAGMGIVERIDVYAPMLWVALLSMALLRGRETKTRIARSPRISDRDRVRSTRYQPRAPRSFHSTGRST